MPCCIMVAVHHCCHGNVLPLALHSAAQEQLHWQRTPPYTSLGTLPLLALGTWTHSQPIGGNQGQLCDLYTQTSYILVN